MRHTLFFVSTFLLTIPFTTNGMLNSAGTDPLNAYPKATIRDIFGRPNPFLSKQELSYTPIINADEVDENYPQPQFKAPLMTFSAAKKIKKLKLKKRVTQIRKEIFVPLKEQRIDLQVETHNAIGNKLLNLEAQTDKVVACFNRVGTDTHDTNQIQEECNKEKGTLYNLTFKLEAMPIVSKRTFPTSIDSRTQSFINRETSNITASTQKRIQQYVRNHITSRVEEAIEECKNKAKNKTTEEIKTKINLRALKLRKVSDFAPLEKKTESEALAETETILRALIRDGFISVDSDAKEPIQLSEKNRSADKDLYSFLQDLQKADVDSVRVKGKGIFFRDQKTPSLVQSSIKGWRPADIKKEWIKILLESSENKQSQISSRIKKMMQSILLVQKELNEAHPSIVPQDEDIDETKYNAIKQWLSERIIEPLWQIDRVTADEFATNIPYFDLDRFSPHLIAKIGAEAVNNAIKEDKGISLDQLIKNTLLLSLLWQTEPKVAGMQPEIINLIEQITLKSIDIFNRVKKSNTNHTVLKEELIKYLTEALLFQIPALKDKANDISRLIKSDILPRLSIKKLSIKRFSYRIARLLRSLEDKDLIIF